MSKKSQFDPTDESDPRYDPARDPTHPFYEKDGAEGEQEADPSDDGAYKVGPGRPPKQYTWKPGHPSPNPKGRPRKIPSMKPDLSKALEDALNEKVSVKKGDKEVMLSKAVLGIQQLVNQFAKGDPRARRDVFQYCELLGVDLQGKELVAELLSPSDQAIVDAFLRRQQLTVADTNDIHVKAPPDLLDDDALKATPEQVAPEPRPPRRITKMPVEPVFDENGVSLPITDRRYIRTQSDRELAWQKKQAES
jgi:uncharacterized protein DUF5681